MPALEYKFKFTNFSDDYDFTKMRQAVLLWVKERVDFLFLYNKEPKIDGAMVSLTPPPMKVFSIHFLGLTLLLFCLLDQRKYILM